MGQPPILLLRIEFARKVLQARFKTSERVYVLQEHAGWSFITSWLVTDFLFVLQLYRWKFWSFLLTVKFHSFGIQEVWIVTAGVKMTQKENQPGKPLWSTLGDIISTLGVFSTVGGYHQFFEGYHQYIGGHSVLWEILSVLISINLKDCIVPLFTFGCIFYESWRCSSYKYRSKELSKLCVAMLPTLIITHNRVSTNKYVFIYFDKSSLQLKAYFTCNKYYCSVHFLT